MEVKQKPDAPVSFNLSRAGKATLCAKLPAHINQFFRGCKILTSGDKDFSKLKGLPCSARTGCHFLRGSPPAAHSYLGTVCPGTSRACADGFSQQQGSLEHSWANSSSSTGTPEWQCYQSPCLFTWWEPWPVRSQASGEVWQWPPWHLCDLSPLLLQLGIFPCPFIHFWLPVKKWV